MEFRGVSQIIKYKFGLLNKNEMYAEIHYNLEPK